MGGARAAAHRRSAVSSVRPAPVRRECALDHRCVASTTPLISKGFAPELVCARPRGMRHRTAPHPWIWLRGRASGPRAPRPGSGLPQHCLGRATAVPVTAGCCVLQRSTQPKAPAAPPASVPGSVWVCPTPAPSVRPGPARGLRPCVSAATERGGCAGREGNCRFLAIWRHAAFECVGESARPGVPPCRGGRHYGRGRRCHPTARAAQSACERRAVARLCRRRRGRRGVERRRGAEKERAPHCCGQLGSGD